MNSVITICWFVIGLVMGSFYHVVGYRLPKNESILTPKHSYCPDCGKKLEKRDLIPVISYVLSLGKCRHCKSKISIFYPVVEVLTGLLFALCYHMFNYSYEFYIGVILSSLFIIILVSDITYYIIPDEVLIIGSILIIVLKIIFTGFIETGLSILSGGLMFIVMYLIMLLGNFMFKKESLGGADIKLMFISGLVLGPILSLIVIFLSSIIALPIAIVLSVVNNERMIPYGPFITIAIFILFILKIDVNKIIEFLTIV